MKVMNILHDSIVDGKGLRTVIFFAGCPHHCEGCHNPQSWNSGNGKEMSIEEIFDEIMQNELSDVTLSGGEPFLQAEEIVHLVSRIKDEGKNIWCYTGYLFEDLLKNLHHVQLLNFIDVLVDGRFELTKRDLSLLNRGSSNQRIIDVPASLKNNRIIEVY